MIKTLNKNFIVCIALLFSVFLSFPSAIAQSTYTDIALPYSGTDFDSDYKFAVYRLDLSNTSISSRVKLFGYSTDKELSIYKRDTDIRVRKGSSDFTVQGAGANVIDFSKVIVELISNTDSDIALVVGAKSTTGNQIEFNNLSTNLSKDTTLTGIETNDNIEWVRKYNSYQSHDNLDAILTASLTTSPSTPDPSTPDPSTPSITNNISSSFVYDPDDGVGENAINLFGDFSQIFPIAISALLTVIVVILFLQIARRVVREVKEFIKKLFKF